MFAVFSSATARRSHGQLPSSRVIYPRPGLGRYIHLRSPEPGIADTSGAPRLPLLARSSVASNARDAPSSSDTPSHPLSLWKIGHLMDTSVSLSWPPCRSNSGSTFPTTIDVYTLLLWANPLSLAPEFGARSQRGLPTGPLFSLMPPVSALSHEFRAGLSEHSQPTARYPLPKTQDSLIDEGELCARME